MLRILKALSFRQPGSEVAAMRKMLISLMLRPLAALAQNEAPPPPDPAAPPATTGTTLVDDREADEAPLPEKIVEPAPPEAEPAVSIRTDSSGDVVEEYRQNGRI